MTWTRSLGLLATVPSIGTVLLSDNVLCSDMLLVDLRHILLRR